MEIKLHYHKRLSWQSRGKEVKYKRTSVFTQHTGKWQDRVRDAQQHSTRAVEALECEPEDSNPPYPPQEV